MANHLADQTSPYLKQHKDNPVDWYPWGEAALSRARDENKPIFISIGYAACHWCHVMAHESFEDQNIANFLNGNFINIKVDREERPDLDDIYMQAVVMLTGRGGWPMSVFLTPELKPFYGGTYFPPSPRQGLPSFHQVLQMVVDAWHTQPEAVRHNAEILTNEILKEQENPVPSEIILDLDVIIHHLHANYDWRTGGWGGAPKFPQPMLIEFLIQQALTGNQLACDMVDHLLEKMALGGMYDIVGGGFHRYSTDTAWLIPHFEKMLYDNAQLSLTYLHGYKLTEKANFRQVVINTLDFIRREMSNPKGGFISSIDADTHEGEGRYYGWEISELTDILSEENFNFLKELTDISESGNFESGLNILQLKAPLKQIADQMQISEEDLSIRLQKVLSVLRDAREARVPPGKDHKVIVEWNGIAVRAFTEAGLLLERKDYLEIAKKGMQFLLNHTLTPDVRLHRTWNDGLSRHPGTLADYANLIIALNNVYNINFNPKLFEQMQSLFTTLQEIFTSDEGLYYDTDANVSDLIVRPRSLQDNTIPSGNALAAYVHWLFANYENNPRHFDAARAMVSQVTEKAGKYPLHHGAWLQVAGLLAKDSKQVALVSKGPLTSLSSFLDIYRKTYRPFSIIAAKHTDFQFQAGFPSLLRDRTTINGKPTAYVCEGFTCQMPVNTPEAFEHQLDQE